MCRMRLIEFDDYVLGDLVAIGPCADEEHDKGTPPEEGHASCQEHPVTNGVL